MFQVSRSTEEGASMRVKMKATMEGMVVDMDQSIGKLAKVNFMNIIVTVVLSTVLAFFIVLQWSHLRVLVCS